MRQQGDSIHPILIQWGPLTVVTHDAFTVLALGVGLALYYRELRLWGWLGGPIVWISMAAVLGGTIGARLDADRGAPPAVLRPRGFH